MDQIQATKPGLVFLDVQMPDMDGFEVLRRLPQALLPVVIFTTAYDQHALRAFEVNALDYLLKPFKPTRFKEAVQRARDLIANKEAGVAARGLLALLGQTPAPAGQLTRLAVKTPGKVTFVELDQIQAIVITRDFLTPDSDGRMERPAGAELSLRFDRTVFHSLWSTAK